MNLPRFSEPFDPDVCWNDKHGKWETANHELHGDRRAANRSARIRRMYAIIDAYDPVDLDPVYPRTVAIWLEDNGYTIVPRP